MSATAARLQNILLPDGWQISTDELELSYARSSGKGGQNVNKVSSKALLRWKVVGTRGVPEEVLHRFCEQFSSRLTNDGDILISVEESRDQIRNAEMCFERLREMLLSVWRAPKKRFKTKPTRSSQRRRVEGKKLRGETKALRRKVD